MVVPAALFVLTLAGGGLVASRWLPALAADRVGRLAFILVCVLLGIALAITGLEIYETVRVINRFPANIGGTAKSDLLASGLITILTDAGPLLGLAAAVYLLAPEGDGPRPE